MKYLAVLGLIVILSACGGGAVASGSRPHAEPSGNTLVVTCSK